MKNILYIILKTSSVCGLYIEIVQDEGNRKLVFVLLNCNLFYAKVNNNFSINRLYTYFYKMALRFIRFREIKTTK